jgi:hypothetical protein
METEHHTPEEKEDSISILLVSPTGDKFSQDFYNSHKIDFPEHKIIISDCRGERDEDRFLTTFLYYCMEFEDGIGEASNDLFWAIMTMIKKYKGTLSEDDKLLTRPSLPAILELNPEMGKYYCRYLKRISDKPAGVYVYNRIIGRSIAYIDSSIMVIS